MASQIRRIYIGQSWTFGCSFLLPYPFSSRSVLRFVVASVVALIGGCRCAVGSFLILVLCLVLDPGGFVEWWLD